METILFINACARPHSRTYQLAQHVLQGFPGRVLEINLYEENIPPLDWSLLQQRENCVQQGDDSAAVFRYAKQFAQADLVVIAAPFWDLAFPALLKIYIEQVSVDGITFGANEKGLVGLCRGTDLVFLTTRGGFYTGDPLEMGSRYLDALHTFFGFDRYHCVAADGMNVAGFDAESSLQTACAQAQALAASL